MTAPALPLKFQIGARTLWTVRRRLVRVPLSLADALAGEAPVLPPLPVGAHGYLVTSLPEGSEWGGTLHPHPSGASRLPPSPIGRGKGPARRSRVGRVRVNGIELFGFARQRYTRHYADLRGGFDTYWATLSGNTRSSLKRKAKRVAAASGGALAVRRFRTPDELTDFHHIARAISARTYQERLLDAGLPADDRFVQVMLRLAAEDRVRAWVLEIGGVPAAYLYCPAESDTLLYQYVGHDPAFAELSPGSVLQLEALRDLFAEGRFARFDFTEGEGQHKRSFATGGVACVDLLLLRRTFANRVVAAALGAFDGAVAFAKRVVGRLALHDLARAVRR